MPASTFTALKHARTAVHQAEIELDDLRQSIARFDAQVSQRLGRLLDALSALEGEVEALNEALLNIREQRLYGEHQMFYAEGAPRPARNSRRAYIPNQDVFDEPPPAVATAAPAILDEEAELRHLYRRLARTYHPDLAVNDAEHAERNRQMALINQAYAARDLAMLRRLWCEEGLDGGRSEAFPPAVPEAAEPSELERLHARLLELRGQIARLQNHPTIQLSLEVKLAQRKGHDLLGEIAIALRRKIARKTAERDYLRSQIAHQV